jgi:hypothetical protein
MSAPPRPRLCDDSGQILAEAAIGLAILAFGWILLTYALYMANSYLRTEMAARYAAWYQANNGSGTAIPSGTLGPLFFGTAGCLVDQGNAQVSSYQPSASENLFSLSDGLATNGPFKAAVSFGATDSTSAGTYPYVLLKNKVPFMIGFQDKTSPLLTVVQSSCQWDGDRDVWSSPGAVLSAVWGELTSKATPVKP